MIALLPAPKLIGTLHNLMHKMSKKDFMAAHGKLILEQYDLTEYIKVDNSNSDADNKEEDGDDDVETEISDRDYCKDGAQLAKGEGNFAAEQAWFTGLVGGGGQ
jgi:hypothetical protein